MEKLLEESAKAKDEFINVTKVKEVIYEALQHVVCDCRQLCKTQMSYERTNASNIFKIKEHGNHIDKIFQSLEQFATLRKQI